MGKGFILLHRKILSWEWYNTPNTLRVFIHLLLKANHKPQKWQGVSILTGQLITGRLKLAEELNLSEMQIRTALKHLKSTNEITIKATKKYSIITVNNWFEYQKINQQVTNYKNRNNQQITTNNNDNNETNNNKKEILTDYESLSR